MLSIFFFMVSGSGVMHGNFIYLYKNVIYLYKNFVLQNYINYHLNFLLRVKVTVLCISCVGEHVTAESLVVCKRYSEV